MSTYLDDEYVLLRHRMVETQLRGHGISDKLVLKAMERVRRPLFVPPTARHAAYCDGPLPIVQGQTISQPYSLGYEEAAPYDGILVTAAAPSVPDALRRQLGLCGRMVIPVSTRNRQDLKLIERPGEPKTPSESSYRETSILGCILAPLIGEDEYRK